jgi:hypothetical protein
LDVAGTIRFLLDGKVHAVADCAPTTTVLEYLRERLGRSGTKEAAPRAIAAPARWFWPNSRARTSVTGR